MCRLTSHNHSLVLLNETILSFVRNWIWPILGPNRTSRVPALTESALKQLLRLPADADLTSSFSDLGIDSWDFIEARTVLETKFGLCFTDDEWMSLERPADMLVRRSTA